MLIDNVRKDEGTYLVGDEELKDALKDVSPPVSIRRSWDNLPKSLFPFEHMWADDAERNPSPPPAEEIGRDLRTIENAVVWLSHPSNWVMDFYIVRWDGVVPKLNRSHAYRMAPSSSEKEFLARVVIEEQARLKGRLKFGMTERVEKDGQDGP